MGERGPGSAPWEQQGGLRAWATCLPSRSDSTGYVLVSRLFMYSCSACSRASISDRSADGSSYRFSLSARLVAVGVLARRFLRPASPRGAPLGPFQEEELKGFLPLGARRLPLRGTGSE